MIGVPACWQHQNKEPETAIYVAIDDKVPPTFSLSGPWWASEFKVLQVLLPPGDTERGHDFTKDRQVWRISLVENRGARVKNWPKVSYGIVPNGLKQDFPQTGRPEQLMEGKLYIAMAVDIIGNGGSCYFVIRNGKPSSVPITEVFSGGQ